MARKIMEAASAGLDHPAFQGVPRTTGKEPGNQGETEMKLLMFVDGESSLKDLSEVLSLDADAVIQAVVALYGSGVLEFDQEFVSQWLSEKEPSGEQAVAPPPVQSRPAPSAQARPPEPTSEKLRVMEATPSRPTAFPEAPRLSKAPEGGSAATAEAEGEEAEDEPQGEIVEEGRLDEMPAWQVMTRLGRTDLTGRLRLRQPTGHRDILLMKGKPVFATSEMEEEDLGALLRSRDRISDEDHQRYREARSTSDAEASRILVKLGIVPEYNRLRALRWQVQTIVFESLSADEGTFLVEKLDALPRRLPRFDINFSRILTRFLDEKMPVDEQIDQLEQKLELYVVAQREDAPLSFQDKEQRLWGIIQERPRKLKDVLSVSTLYRRETFKFVLLLLVNGLVELARNVVVEEGPLDLRMLQDIAEDLKEQNHFDALGLHAVSDEKDVQSGYKRMMKKFDPKAFTKLTDDQRALLEQCRARLQEAYQGLATEEMRNKYRHQVFSKYQLAQFAQLQYQKGEIYLWWRQDPPQAFPFFRSAFELDPAQPVYWAAYAISALAGGSTDSGVRRHALGLAERIAKLKNADPVAMVMAGGAFIKGGQVGKGEELVQKGVARAGGTTAIQKMSRVIHAI